MLLFLQLSHLIAKDHSNAKQWIKSAPERKSWPISLCFPLLAVLFMLYGSVSETHGSKTAARNFVWQTESVFSLEMTQYAKGTEGYAVFQTISHAQQTAAEQTPDTPAEPTNAEIYFRIVLYYLGKAQSWRYNLDHSEADSNTIPQQMRTSVTAVSTSSYWFTDYSLTPQQFVWEAVLATLSGAVSMPHGMVWFVKFRRAPSQHSFIA